MQNLRSFNTFINEKMQSNFLRDILSKHKPWFKEELRKYVDFSRVKDSDFIKIDNQQILSKKPYSTPEYLIFVFDDKMNLVYIINGKDVTETDRSDHSSRRDIIQDTDAGYQFYVLKVATEDKSKSGYWYDTDVTKLRSQRSRAKHGANFDQEEFNADALHTNRETFSKKLRTSKDYSHIFDKIKECLTISQQYDLTKIEARKCFSFDKGEEFFETERKLEEDQNLLTFKDAYKNITDSYNTCDTLTEVLIKISQQLNKYIGSNGMYAETVKIKEIKNIEKILQSFPTTDESFAKQYLDQNAWRINKTLRDSNKRTGVLD